MVNWIKLTLIAFPVSAALVSMKEGKLKYGYDFFEVDHNWSIVIAIGIGLTLNTWHTLSFEEIGNFDLKQYLKQRQRYLITGTKGWNAQIVESKVNRFIASQRRWKVKGQDNSYLKLSTKNKYGFEDVVSLTPTDQGIVVESRPRYWFPFVDLGRNLKNVQLISKYLKEEDHS